MATINVAKAFNLTMPDAITTRYEEGEHEVSQEVADHWYTKAHLAEVKPKKAKDEEK